MNELMVFPTELALRRFQQEQALEQGWVDASGHTTFARLRKLCLPYAHLKGRRMSAMQQLLMRRQVIEVAQGHFDGKGTLGELSSVALAEVLDQLIKELASLPNETARIVEWMLDRPRNHKLYQLGTLFSVWRAVIKQEGYADAIDVNQSILRLLRGSRDAWPPLLRDALRITFRSVRWFNPFEELCVAALNHTLKVRVESALPPAHAEGAGDRLGQRVRAEIMTDPWAMWAENLGDALAVDSPDLLQLDDTARIHFSRSSGVYGEIEDLARRIGWHLRYNELPPNRIALVVPDISAVQDIIPHVFGRFKIPYYFRRGRPVLSSPCVKAFLSWLAFPLRFERDALIDLVRNPAVRMDPREALVEQLIKLPPRVVDSTAVPSQLQPIFKATQSAAEALQLLKERVVEPEDHFNREALSAVAAALEGFGHQVLPLSELIHLIEELLENATVKPRDSHEQGVWVLNPHDAVGLEFDLVLFAGLNEGEFPSIPQQDALLSDNERQRLRNYLKEQGRYLPALALPKADVLFEQQSVLFLSALGMARHQLVLSYRSADQEGSEKSESAFFRKLWTLAGWPAQVEPGLCAYDQWRIAQLGEDSIFARHFAAQQTTPSEDRVPMPGESFLPIIPLALCCAPDEALQAAVQGRQDACGTGQVQGRQDACGMGQEQGRQDACGSGAVEHLVEMLRIEGERAAFLDAPLNERAPSIYCGHIPQLKQKVEDWLAAQPALSPTALETLAQCRYVFLLERVLRLRDERSLDDTPDPMERGGLIHSILHKIYSALADGTSGIDVPRRWTVKASTGWRLRGEGGVDAVPLVVFEPAQEEEYIAFARSIAESELDAAALGHPGIWAAEREKVMEQILNLVRYDVQSCAAENRFPAQFEFHFCDETAVPLDELRLKGVVDRVDLVFAESGELKKVRVLDYKGASRARSGAEEYRREIVRNLDCQLPVYAFAAQRHWFGEHNSASVNAMTEAGYLFYERRLSDVAAKSKKSLIELNEPGLLEGFVETLVENIRRLKECDFAVDPLIASYTDYASICRTIAVTVDELE
ncbi:MAG: exodeoxyribonuclease V subunit gamma [Pontiellaceae bacterium]|nr:exodeoxyribonuclease V subunit gamma [Pontiellaceae bacterium]